MDKRGKDDLLCMQRGRDYNVVCPDKWVEDWKDAVQAGNSMSVGTAFIKE